MYTSQFNVSSKFIKDETEKTIVPPVSFPDDCTNSLPVIEQHSSSKSNKSAARFDVSPEEHERHMAKMFIDDEPSIKNEMNTSEKELPEQYRQSNINTSGNDAINDSLSTIEQQSSSKSKNPVSFDASSEEHEKHMAKMFTDDEPSIKNEMDISEKELPEQYRQSNIDTSRNDAINANIQSKNIVIDRKNGIANLIEGQPIVKKTKNTFDMKEYIKKIYTFIHSEDLYCYDQIRGYYRKLTKDDLGRMIYSIFNDDITRQLNPYNDISAIYRALCLDPTIQNPVFTNNQLLINCINTVICIKIENGLSSINVLPHDKQYGFLNCINATFVNCNSIKNTQFELFLLSITNGDLQLINLLREILGYILSNLNNAKKFFIFYGKSNSGKSVLLNLITHFIGDENVSNIEMENLSDPKYSAQLRGKLLNVCSELPDKGISDTGTIKALVSENDKVSARRLYDSPFSFYNKAKLVFATNNLPEIKTASYKDNSAFTNRIIIVPFVNSIPEDKQDKYLLEKLLLEKDIIFSWAIGGLLSYINNGYRFSYSNAAQKYLDYYRDNINNYVAFINSRCDICQGKYIFSDDLFLAYEDYCYENLLDRPTNRDKKCLKQMLIDTFNISYRRLHREGYNKWGFDGICLVNFNQ